MLRVVRRHRLSVVAAAVLLVVGVAALVLGLSRQQPAPPEVRSAQRTADAAPAPPAPTGSATGQPPAEAEVMEASDPTRLSIPAIGVDTSLERLGLDGERAMQTPRDPARAGWFTPGPDPGAQGPAVLAGHVTWNGSKAVFFDLARLGRGDHVYVDRKDGSTARFTITRVEQYAKDRFPSLEVYRNIDHAGLRLITCSGTYSGHRYSDNTVVYARLDNPAS
ncbi:class F sortase [Streptomyces sp. SID14478]|uniref:class F sortase n=1 Tax=Streptomyces sp. SID14478 TaxID=2706073 RepID=UPI0013D93AB0|nr:class F sortase [Streptomyces sp. SID14478]NEB75464.1 class F sortase [Streptomyces sp. SID14478]